MKPLYVDGRRARRVTLRDDSLRIESQDQAARLVPIGQLSRAVSSGAVDWDSSALRGLMRRGITVTFLDSAGHVEGYCLGACRQRLELAQRIEELFDRPDWADLYRNWFNATQRAAMQSVSLGKDESAPTPRAVRTRLLEFRAAMMGIKRARKLEDTLRGELLALVAAWLFAPGIHPRHIVAQEGEMSLSHGLARLLEWEIQPRLEARLGRKLPGNTLRYVTGLVERHDSWLRGRFAAHIASLERWLREMAE